MGCTDFNVRKGTCTLAPLDWGASLAVVAGGLNGVDTDGFDFAADGLWVVARGECLSACVARTAAGFGGGVSDFPRLKSFTFLRAASSPAHALPP